jgi:CubicO group peptidase (beta-lactamase class C family)
MGIILISSIITQIEYRNNTWKQLYTTPQKLSTIFWSKYLILLFHFFLFFLLFNCGIFLSGALPALIFNDVVYPLEQFPFKEYLNGNLNYLIYCLPIIALQYLLSLHIRSFVVSIGIGLALVIASLIGISFQYGYVIPYVYGAMEFLLADNKIDPNVKIIYWALGYFLFFTLANYLIFMCKTQTKTPKYFTIKKLITLLVIILIVGIYFGISVSSKSKTESLSQNNGQEKLESKIAFEQNLGAFILKGNNEWSLKERMKFYNVNGVSIALIKNYKIEWVEGYGYANLENKSPVTENTIFEPGSISKSINALALMKLVQEKKIDPFVDINDYLISWKFPYDEKSKGKKITLANLLSHTAGLNIHGFEGYKPGDKLPTISELLDGKYPANSLPVRSLFEPSKMMEYSGGGIMISQLMLMDIVKQDYDKYLNENIFVPLGMKNSFFTQPVPNNKKALTATGYDRLGKPVKGNYPIMKEQAAAGIWTTPTDLGKFVIEMQLSLKGKSNKILNQQNTEFMLTPYLNETTSLGFFIIENQGYQYFSHDAGNIGFGGTFCGSLEKGDGLVILINSENSGIINEIRNAIIDTYNWAGFDKKVTKKEIKVADSILDKYVGKYEAKVEGRKVEIKKGNDGLYYISEDESRKMYFTSNREFINMENPSIKKFNFSKTDVVTGFTINYKGKHLTFNKIK